MENKLNFGVYVLYDHATENYGLPFVANNNDVALRNVVSSIIHLDDNVIMDFELIEIGQYDSDNGKIDGYQLHSSIASPRDILTKVHHCREELDEIKKKALQELEELKKLKEDK